MIHLKNLHLTFNHGTPLEVEVLRGIHLKVEAGEFVTVIGSNGAGKSTLMNVLSGDLRVDQGHILPDGIDITQQPTHKRAQYVSRVFQDPMLGTCASLTIEENLALAFDRGACRGVGLALKGHRDYFKERLADLGIGLEKRLKDPMGALSGGQRQAVSLLMATLKPSKVLLLDEHTAALDPKMARVVMDLTERLVAQEERAVFMITHSMTQALDHGTRTLLMHQGQIIKDLTGKERSKLQPMDLHGFFDEI